MTESSATARRHGTIGDMMGEAVTAEVVSAVAKAYQVLADICIGREREIYREQAAAQGGWNGYRHFIVDRIDQECVLIRSFYL